MVVEIAVDGTIRLIPAPEKHEASKDGTFDPEGKIVL
jgi:hypothetical protein